MTTTPKHRRDVVDMPALIELDQLQRDHEISVSRSGPFQHVHTTHRRTGEHDGQVLMVLSPAAANTLGMALARFTSMYGGGPMVGLEDYDPSLWQDVAMDLLRHKAHAGHVPEPHQPTAGGRHMRAVR
ncbi:hypothetical protein GCM10009795_040240 [Nocardioides hankookensis]|uniref:Uncharacterized protein n=1 Tax=Nocardioides hankookensis TaxID=443157 RepID=A0ABW1LPC1_9ACTN